MIRLLLFFIYIFIFFRESYSINGVIWIKEKQKFAPIFDISTFRNFDEEVSIQKVSLIQTMRKYHYQGKIFTLNYFEYPSMVQFIENNTKVTGLFAETWNVLSEILNFTVKPIKENTWGVGKRLPNGSYTSILGKISRNEIDIIPRTSMIESYCGAMKMIQPLQRINYRFHIKRRETYGSFWMVKVFSWNVWLLIAVTHLFLTISGFLSQKRLNIKTRIGSNLIEHYFYNFSAICNQGFVPINFRGRSRLLELTLTVFAQLITMAFSALLLTYLTQKTFRPPFTDMKSMLDDTDYSLVVLNNSYVHNLLQSEENVDMMSKQGRYLIVNSVESLYKLVCSNARNYATITTYGGKKSSEAYFCTLHPIGRPLQDIHLTSGLKKEFKCVECINSKVLKIRETGIFNSMYQRWVEVHNVKDLNPSQPNSITMQQVYILFSVLGFGAFLATIMFLIETITFNFRSLDNRSVRM